MTTDTMSVSEKVKRFRYLLNFRWRCDRPQCDGLPHIGFPHKHARYTQLVDNATITMFMTGRGFGKTRAAAERVKERMLAHPKHRVNIIAPTFAVGRDVCIEGESGLLSLLPDDRVKAWNRSTGELVLTNGARAKIYSVATFDGAERIRGSQSHTVWCEEVSTWRYAQHGWDMAQFANRLTGAPGGTQTLVTCTPKNTPLLKKILNIKGMRLVNGSTLENASNLAPSYVEYLKQNYEGTRLGLQELEGQLLEDVVGALWTREMIHEVSEEPASYARIVVGVDPAGGHREGTNAQTGIIVVGKGADGRVYVLEDASGHMSPEQWAAKAAEMYDKYEADAIVVEVNFGAAMVKSNMKAYGGTHTNIREVRATRGKQLRAEPVVTLYENKRCVHVGSLPDLEQQMCQWIPPGQAEVDEHGVESPVPASKYSPDRIDALVWAVTDLVLQVRPRRELTYRG